MYIYIFFLQEWDIDKVFEIHTDAGDRQLGAVISQEGKPLAFYSRKLSSAQRNCENIDQLLDGCQLILISNERRNGEIHIHTII